MAWELGEKQWKLEGWSYGLVEYVTSEMSEALARRRRGLVIQTFSQPVEWGMALIRAEAPVPLQTLMKPLVWEEAELWVRPEKLDVRGGIPRDQMLPQAVRLRHERSGQISQLAEESGRLEEMLVFDRAGPPESDHQ